MAKNNKIRVAGAREHNLKNITVEIPRDKMVVITGLSGSGKSTLAFDTIYAEGQRRYVESLSAYARQFLGMMEKPDVDYIDGLSPAISIEQKTTHKNPRSTVGTVTEIYDYLRLLYARIGTVFCYSCGRPIERQTPQQMVDAILIHPEKTRLQVLAPIIRGRKGEYKDLFASFKKQGFVRVIVDGEMRDLDQEITLEKKKKHTISIVVDRIVLKKGIRQRLTESVELALKMTSGIVDIHFTEEDRVQTFSEKFACMHCHISYNEVEPRLFSFNSPFGACPTCDGLGTHLEIDPELLVPDQSKSINQGALLALGKSLNGWNYGMVETLAEHFHTSLDVPWEKTPEEFRQAVLEGTSDKIKFKYKSEKSYFEYNSEFEGYINNLMRRYKQTNSQHVRTWIESFMNRKKCPDCEGGRLRKEALSIRINNLNIFQATELSIEKALEFFSNLQLSEREATIARQVLKEINSRLMFLKNVGLGYLTLSRMAGTLSGGEAQRIRLATQIGSQLVGVLYILDEPSIGLHQRDNSRLIHTLKRLRDLGNTVLVVEHDRDTMEASDWILDLGPGAGIHGGEIIAQGPPDKIKKNKKSLTGQYLSGIKFMQWPDKRREGNGLQLKLQGARGNNLKNISVEFPLGKFICVTGVSGSGKSTLINETLYPILARKLMRARAIPLEYESFAGIEYVDKVINIDQSPIGRTPRSNPATYTGVFTPIRDLFSMLPESKIRGYKPGRFSFNVKGGRCEACQGDGIVKIEMNFLPDIYVPCETCKGKRYNRETLEITYRGKTISDVLEMTVNQAHEFFEAIPQIKRKLQTLSDVGLGYIHLGQQATTLSGGEAQRVKLATELSKIGTGKTLYILDEPTTGLHFHDIKILLEVLNRLVEKGNTVIIIEHNLDVVKSADWIIDLGPEGGDRGGEVIFSGTPEEIIQDPNSHTGYFLKQEFERDQLYKEKKNNAGTVFISGSN